MSARVIFLAAACALVAGCVTPPAGDSTDRPAPAPPTQAPSSIDVLEERHRELAQAYVSARNWADALVQWELLTLLKSDSREYREAMADARTRIRDAAASLTRAAEQARQQGNFDQATLLYLRVLNVDRENSAAAQALRDIDADRTRRAYINRPPRMAM